MAAVVNELISSVLQVVAFALIPFVFFLFRKDKSVSFLKYIGLHNTTAIAMRYAVYTSLLFLSTGLVIIFFDDSIRAIVLTPPSVTGKIRTIEAEEVAVIVILLVALVKTSLSEEIFFRGFISKRLINAWGFSIGNTFQAIIFGVVHVVLFWKLMNAGIVPLVFIFSLSTIGGWVIGLIKEKYGNGSIIPGWIAHGLGNTISYFTIVFIL